MFAEFGSGQALLTIFWIFLFVIWFWLLIMIFGDVFRDHELSGGMKAFWCIFVILLPYLGIFIYLIVRGGGMTERSIKAAQEQQQQFASYVKDTAGADSAADQIAKAKALLDQGTITNEEFEQMKARALA